MAEGDKIIVAELQNLQGFLANSMEALFEKVDDIVTGVGSVLDYLKDTEKKSKTDKAADVTKKSADAISGKSEAGSLLKGFSLKDISDNIVQLSKGLLSYAKAEAKGAPTAFIKFLKDLQGVLTSEGALKNPEQILKMYEAIGKSISYMGEGLAKFSMGLLLFAIPAKLKLTDLFITFIKDFFSSKVMGKLDPKKAKEVGEALETIAVGILKFAGYLMLATLAMVIGAPGLLIILPAIMLVMGTLSLFSKKSKQIKEGAEAIKEMAIGLLFFTGALILMRFVRPEDLLIAIGVIAVFGLFVLMLGLIGKIVKGGMSGLKKAGQAVMELSLGLIAFTLAIIIMRFVEWEDIFKTILVVAIFSLFVLAMGESKNIKSGAIAFAVIAISMVILAFAIMQYKDIEWETIGKVGACIGGLTIALMALGANGKQVLIGSISLIVASLSIGILGYMLSMWQDFKITDETLIQVGLAIGGLTLVLVVLGAMGPVVLLGAFALAVVAVSLTGSLILLGMALGRFKDVGWTEDDQAAMNTALIGIPTAITTGFIDAGGLMLMLALPAMIATSLALAPIVWALESFKKSGIVEDDAIMAGAVVGTLISSMREPIEAIGKGGGLFSDSDFENGVEAIDGLGSLLSEIAAGVKSMAKLEYKSLTGAIVKITPADIAAVGTNTVSLIDALKAPIMEIGSNSKPVKPSGFLGALGLDMLLPDDNDFRQGMKAISGLGDLLSGIAKGVVDFAKMEFKGLDGKIVPVDDVKIAAVGTNVTKLLDGLKKPIIEIGNMSSPVESSGFLRLLGLDMVLPDDNEFRQGMDAVSGLGELLSGIAAGVTAMGTGVFPDPSDPTGKKKLSPLDIAGNVSDVVKKMINALKDPIIAIGKDAMQTDTGVLGWIFGDSIAGDKISTFKDAGFKQGMDALGGLGSLLTGIAGAIKTFGVGKLPDPSDPTGKTYIDVESIIPKMQKVFTSIIVGLKIPIISFAALDEKVIDKATDRSKSIVSFVKNVSAMVKSAAEAVVSYDSAPTFSVSLPASATAINLAATKLMGNGAFSKDKDVDNFTKITASIVKLANADNKLQSVAVSMKSISESMISVFASLNTVLEEKLKAVSTMFEKMVELDKIDAEAMKKKIDTYKELIEAADKMNFDSVKKIMEAGNGMSADLQTTMKDIAVSLAEISANTKTSKELLWTIKRNTGIEAKQEV